MFEDQLLNYGAAGVFILYLIYDRQVIIKGLKDSMNKLTEAITKHL